MHVEELVEEIAALENRLADAQKLRSRPVLRRLVAADFRGFTAFGRLVSREEFLFEFDQPELSLESVELENISIRVFEHVGIASGLTLAHGRFRNYPFRRCCHFTDVWARREMRWLLVARHASHVST